MGERGDVKGIACGFLVAARDAPGAGRRVLRTSTGTPEMVRFEPENLLSLVSRFLSLGVLPLVVFACVLVARSDRLKCVPGGSLWLGLGWPLVVPLSGARRVALAARLGAVSYLSSGQRFREVHHVVR